MSYKILGREELEEEIRQIHHHSVENRQCFLRHFNKIISSHEYLQEELEKAVFRADKLLEGYTDVRLKLQEAEKDYQELKNKIIVGWDVELLRWKMLSCSTSEYVGKEIPISELGKLVEKLRIK